VKDLYALMQPLITRPAYEYNRVSESGLPSGGPSSKGLPLDDSIPGSATFAKPEDETRDFDQSKDEPIYRTDYADDQLTDRSRIDVIDDNADRHDGIGYPGKGEWDQRSPKTHYPYRRGLPSTKSASAELVVGLWKLINSPSLYLVPTEIIKVALQIDSIIDGLNPKFVERALQCSVSLKRADIRNLRWIFSVDCGNGPKVVKIKAFRKGNITKLPKMDLDIKCSCPAWRWLGPEYHAKTEDYIDGKPIGTASVPVIKDPTGINRVCKHVASVLSYIRNWEVPKK
jgi:hypothetical protein